VKCKETHLSKFNIDQIEIWRQYLMHVSDNEFGNRKLLLLRKILFLQKIFSIIHFLEFSHILKFILKVKHNISET